MPDAIRYTDTSQLAFPAPVGGVVDGVAYLYGDLVVTPEGTEVAGVWLTHRMKMYTNVVEKQVTASAADINLGDRLYHHAAGVINEVAAAALGVAGYAWVAFADRKLAHTDPVIASGSSANICVIESLV